MGSDPDASHRDQTEELNVQQAENHAEDEEMILDVQCEAGEYYTERPALDISMKDVAHKEEVAAEYPMASINPMASIHSLYPLRIFQKLKKPKMLSSLEASCYQVHDLKAEIPGATEEVCSVKDALLKFLTMIICNAKQETETLPTMVSWHLPVHMFVHSITR